MSGGATKENELHVQLFGGPRVVLRGRPLDLSPQQMSLVALLFGTEAEAQTRSRLVSLIWPGEPPKTARHRLSQLLYALRRRQGDPPLFRVQGEEVYRAAVSSDMLDFQATLRDGPLSDCASLLDLGFCPRLWGQVDRGILDWADGREAELRASLRRSAEGRWLECEKAEDWRGARDAAETRLKLSPSSESWLRRVMEARSKTGAAAEAEGAFNDFGLTVQKSEGKRWTPEIETQYLLREVRSLPAFEDSLPGSDLPSDLAEPPLLGRDEERARLRTTLREVPGEALRPVLLAGEAGIGKTRLIREALTGIPLDGIRVLFAGCAELEQMIPLNVLIDALRDQEVGETLRGLNEPWRTVLFGVMPAHYLGERPIPEAPQIQPGSVPRRLFEAFYQLLLALADEKPVILVLEDLQWADETTLSVLEFLIRRWDHGRLQLLASIRTEEFRRTRVLESFLESIRLHAAFQEIHLGDLSVSESEALIQSLSPRPLHISELAHIRSLAGGNPFFLIELTLEFLAGRLDPGVEPQEILPIPISIRQVLHRRMTELSEDAELALGSLAVYSKPLDTASLARVARLPESRCLAAMDQLHRFRLVTGRGPEVAVSHELIRHAVYQQLAEPRRAWLHNRVADHILGNRADPPPDELALHFHLAGDGARAKSYAMDAAGRAESAGAIAEALRFLRIARERTDDPDEIAELVWRIGHLNYLHQNLEEAAPLLELAAQRLRRHGREEDALRAEIERIDSLAQRGLLPLTECLEELQRVKGEAAASQRWEIHHKALDAEAHQLDRLGDLDGVRSVLDQARQLVNVGTARARCKASTLLALNIYFGSAIEGLHAAREAVALGKTLDDADTLLHALNRLMVVLHYLGRLHSEEGRETLAEATSRLGTCGDLNLKAFVHLNRAVWHLEIGDVDRAKEGLASTEKVLHGTKARDARARLYINLGELGLVSHDISLARENYSRAQEILGSSSPHYFQTLVHAGIGMCALHAGALAEARLREKDLPPLPDFWTFDPSIVATFKARMLTKRRDSETALAMLDAVRKNTENRFVPAWLRLTLEQCRILRRMGSPDLETFAREGLRTAQSLGLEQRTREFKSMI